MWTMGEAVMFSVPCRFLETRDLSSCDSTRKNISSWEWPLSSLPFSGSMPSFSSSVAGRQVFYALIFPLRSNVNNTPFPFVLPRSYFFFFLAHTSCVVAFEAQRTFPSVCHASQHSFPFLCLFLSERDKVSDACFCIIHYTLDWDYWTVLVFLLTGSFLSEKCHTLLFGSRSINSNMYL